MIDKTLYISIQKRTGIVQPGLGTGYVSWVDAIRGQRDRRNSDH